MKKLIYSFLIFSLITAKSYTQTSEDKIPIPDWLAITVDYSSNLVINGESLNFENSEVNNTVSIENTPYGAATVTTITANKDDITREFNIYALDDMSNTYLISQTFSFAKQTTVDRIEVLSASVKGSNMRLTYGPADNTKYMDEDYLNIPIVSGYSKAGSMLFGGLPINYVWGANGGVALGVLTDKAGTYKLPIKVTNSTTVELGHSYEPLSVFNQKTTFNSGDTYNSDVVFISYNQGDYFKPIDTYTKLLELISGRDIQNQPVPEFTKSALWKTWALDPSGSGNFTKDQVRAIADDLETLGINWILLDWGWFLAEGDWGPNWDMFNGVDDFKEFITELKERGFHVGLWFQPVQIDLSDDSASNFTKDLVKTASGSIYIDDDGMGLLDPSLESVKDYVTTSIQNFAAMGIENLYLDSQIAQLAIPPNYANDSPLSSHEALPGLYHDIKKLADTYNMAIEICPDGRSQSILNLPLHVNNIGDPKNDLQLREELKSLKAMLGKNALVGAYVDPFEDNQVSGSFINIMGIGGMIQTMFRDLDDLGKENWKESMDFYNDNQLSTADYLDIYDIGFDYPEGHVVEKGVTRYYSFFTRYEDIDVCLSEVCDDNNGDLNTAENGKSESYSGTISIRELIPNTNYNIVQYGTSTTLKKTSNSEGVIMLDNQSFNREIMFLVTPENAVILDVSQITSEDNSITVYPNPSSNKLNIKKPKDEEGTALKVYIYSISGSLVKESIIKSDESTIDIDELTKGIYLIKFTNPNITNNQNIFKFIKN